MEEMRNVVESDSGWELVCVSTGDHLRRVVEMCRELGFEVYVEELQSDAGSGCHRCLVEGSPAFRVFKRRRK